MIGIPLNDFDCLAPISEIVADLVARRPAWLVDLAAQYPTREGIDEYIRGLPQRDDDGDPDDGPRVDECIPPQRLQIPSPHPNCVERTALRLVLTEVIDPRPVYQMATIDTPIGKHTFPVENGAPIILDPRLPPNCLDCPTAALVGKKVPIDPRAALAWTAQLAEQGAAEVRNGVRLRNVEDLLLGMIDDGDGGREIDADAAEEIAWLLATAEKIAERYGVLGKQIVRATADALRDVAEDNIARRARNAAGIDLGDGMRIQPAPVSALARVAARFGIRAGAQALRIKLATLGIGDAELGMVEQELNKEGYSLGELAPKTSKPSTGAASPMPRTDRGGHTV